MATDSKELLKKYINEALELLDKKAEFVTIGNKLALMDMVEQAKAALKGEKSVPHVRNREFYKPRQEEEVDFALERYTMAPTYSEGSVYHMYGLKPAIDWFLTRDIRYGLDEKDTLEDRAKRVEQQCNEFLKEAEFGKQIGQYEEEFGSELIDAVKQMKELKEDALAKGIIHCLNALRKVKFSRIHRSDIEKDFNIFISEEEFKRIQRDIKTDSVAKEQYDSIKRIADDSTLEQRKKAYELLFEEDNYEYLNQNYKLWMRKEELESFNQGQDKNKQRVLWSSTGTIGSFTAPKDAVYGTITFLLPSVENEEDGLGHVWIDNLEILSALGPSVIIKNPGFETCIEEGEAGSRISYGLPIGWKPKAKKGNPVMNIEEREPFCGSQKRSIYICNPTSKDEGAWEYEEKFELVSGSQYTLTFDCKVDGKLKEGLKAIITFIDKENKKLGTYEYYFNRKAVIPCPFYNLSMQCNAIVYALTKDITYARKAKYEILHMLNDFCQGVEHWLVTNLRPEGSDAYGAVQGGRNLCSIALAYSLIKQAGVFNKEEKERFYNYIDYMLRYMSDYRDRSELLPEEAQKNCSNWQTDMCIGSAMIMMVLTDYPDRKIWMNNAYTVLRGQLECNVNEDGSWPESIRYHHAALERFASYAKVLLLETGEDWFTKTRLGEMFGYSLNTQTPPYEYFDGKIGTPPFGDHKLTDGSEFGIYGLYIGVIEKIDKNLADKMYTTWVRAGKPIKRFWGESLAIDNLLYADDAYKVEEDFKFHLSSTDQFKNAGIYMFRKNFGMEKESYFAIMSSPNKIGHGHLDQGSFMIYKDSVPIVMDSGIEGYFDASTPWHISSYSHACVQFETGKRAEGGAENGFINLSAGSYSLKRGWVDVPRTSKVIECSLGEEIEKIVIEIENPEGVGVHRRTVLYRKEWELYIIKDEIKDFYGKVLMSLPVVSKNSKIHENTIDSQGYYFINLQTIIMSSYESITLEKGRTTLLYPSSEEVAMLEYIRVVADATEGFFTILYPKQKGEENIMVSQTDHGWEVWQGNKKITEISKDL